MYPLPFSIYRCPSNCVDGNQPYGIVADSFSVDVGMMFLIGPALEQQRTCIAGQPCTDAARYGGSRLPPSNFLDLVGVEENDLIFYLDTCGVATSTSRVAPTMAGGQYRMCWQSSEWQIPGQNPNPALGTDIGGLTVMGPYPAQPRTCIAGQTCLFDNVRGVGLQNSDTVRPTPITPTAK